MKIWTFSEKQKYGAELIFGAKNLSEEAHVVCFALDKKTADFYAACGADYVYILPELTKEQPLENYILAFKDLLSVEKPDIFLLSGTARSRDIGARLAAWLGVGLCSDCISLKLDDQKKLVMERMIFGGAGIQSVSCTRNPQMATVMSGVFSGNWSKNSGEIPIQQMEGKIFSAVQVMERKTMERTAANLAESKRIVSIGRGMDKQEDMDMANDLARALQGEVGCTRPIAEEMHWLPEELYIGISGQKVKPDLYVGVGISGQIQHISGMRESKVVVAINKDENAPIFEASDYGIVGDLYEVLPLLTKEVEQIQK